MLITTCPHCHTQFYVSKKQIALANGQVRCGRCRAVFDGKEQMPKADDNSRLFDAITATAAKDDQDPCLRAEATEKTSSLTTYGGYQCGVPRYLGNNIELNNTNTENSPTADFLENLSIPSFDHPSLALNPVATELDPSAPHAPKVNLVTGQTLSIIALLIVPTVILSMQLFYRAPSIPNNITLISSKLALSADQAKLYLKLKITQPSTLEQLPKMQLSLQNAQHQTVSRIHLKPEQYLPTFNVATVNKPIEAHLTFKLKQPQKIKHSQITWINSTT